MSGVESIKVVLLGESGVGKSSLALRFVTDEFRPYSEATIGASFMSKSITIPASSPTNSAPEDNDEAGASGNASPRPSQRHIGFKIWDTAGQEKYRSLAPMYYRGSHAAILVYDITKPDSFAAMQDWADELKQNGPAGLVVVVCGNKSDLHEDRLVGRSTGEKFASSIGASHVETSAKEGEGVEHMFVAVATRVPPPLNLGCEYLEEDMGLDLGKSSEHPSACGC